MESDFEETMVILYHSLFLSILCCCVLQAKTHPLNILLATETYKRGHSKRGKLKWKPNQDVIQALDSAFCKCLSVSMIAQTAGSLYMYLYM